MFFVEAFYFLLERREWQKGGHMSGVNGEAQRINGQIDETDRTSHKYLFWSMFIFTPDSHGGHIDYTILLGWVCIVFRWVHSCYVATSSPFKINAPDDRLLVSGVTIQLLPLQLLGWITSQRGQMAWCPWPSGFPKSPGSLVELQMWTGYLE